MTPTPEANPGADFDQSRIWRHAQNVEPESFRSAGPRLDFLLAQVARRRRGTVPTVLNIGVGDAYFERQAKLRGWRIHSLDPDAESMQRLSGEGIEAHVGSIAEIPLDDATFDFVTASEVLEHLNDGQRTSGCREIARVLKPDGWFLGTVPYREDLSLRRCVCPHCGLVYHQYGHLASFDFSDIQSLLDPQFEIVVMGRAAFVSFRGRSLFGRLKSLSRMILGRLGQQIAVPRLYWIARKRFPVA